MASLEGLKYRFERDIVLPISSFLGYKKLKKMCLKEDEPQWYKSFHNRKVLIVGSGPSLDKVDSKYFSEFDVIIYINHAIKLSGLCNDEYFFSTDINATKRILNKEYFKNVVKLGRKNSIIAPIHFNSILSSERFLNNFSLIAASKPNYIKTLSIKTTLGLSYPRLVYWPVQPSIRELETWFSASEQVLYFPVIESTSALSCILFASKYFPKSVTLIGCDFSKERSKLVINENPAHDINPYEDSRSKFYFLRNFLNKKNILLENHSWTVN